MKKGDAHFTGVEVKSEPHYATGQVDDFGGLPRLTVCAHSAAPDVRTIDLMCHADNLFR